MKDPNLIKLIGVLCIVIGALGVINFITALLLTGMYENQEEWIVNLFYFGSIINGLYLLAGIFFLLRKSFSLKLMHIVLIISLVYGIAGMFFVTRINIFSFISPAIDIALLFLVFRISKYYYKSADEIPKLPETQKTVKPLSRIQLMILSFMGLIFSSIPVYIFGLWIYVSMQANTQALRVDIFHSYFPNFMQGQNTTSYISIIFGMVAVLLATPGLNLSGIFWKILNVFILTICSLLLMMNLFWLM